MWTDEEEQYFRTLIHQSRPGGLLPVGEKKKTWADIALCMNEAREKGIINSQKVFSHARTRQHYHQVMKPYYTNALSASHIVATSSPQSAPEIISKVSSTAIPNIPSSIEEWDKILRARWPDEEEDYFRSLIHQDLVGGLLPVGGEGKTWADIAACMIEAKNSGIVKSKRDYDEHSVRDHYYMAVRPLYSENPNLGTTNVPQTSPAVTYGNQNVSTSEVTQSPLATASRPHAVGAAAYAKTVFLTADGFRSAPMVAGPKQPLAPFSASQTAATGMVAKASHTTVSGSRSASLSTVSNTADVTALETQSVSIVAAQISSVPKLSKPPEAQEAHEAMKVKTSLATARGSQNDFQALVTQTPPLVDSAFQPPPIVVALQPIMPTKSGSRKTSTSSTTGVSHATFSRSQSGVTSVMIKESPIATPELHVSKTIQTSDAAALDSQSPPVLKLVKTPSIIAPGPEPTPTAAPPTASSALLLQPVMAPDPTPQITSMSSSAQLYRADTSGSKLISTFTGPRSTIALVTKSSGSRSTKIALESGSKTPSTTAAPSSTQVPAPDSRSTPITIVPVSAPPKYQSTATSKTPKCNLSTISEQRPSQPTQSASVDRSQSTLASTASTVTAPRSNLAPVFENHSTRPTQNALVSGSQLIPPTTAPGSTPAPVPGSQSISIVTDARSTQGPTSTPQSASKATAHRSTPASTSEFQPRSTAAAPRSTQVPTSESQLKPTATATASAPAPKSHPTPASGSLSTLPAIAPWNTPAPPRRPPPTPTITVAGSIPVYTSESQPSLTATAPMRPSAPVPRSQSAQAPRQASASGFQSAFTGTAPTGVRTPATAPASVPAPAPPVVSGPSVCRPESMFWRVDMAHIPHPLTLKEAKKRSGNWKEEKEEEEEEEEEE